MGDGTVRVRVVELPFVLHLGAMDDASVFGAYRPNVSNNGCHAWEMFASRSDCESGRDGDHTRNVVLGSHRRVRIA